MRENKDHDETGYYLVTVSETVRFSYPVAAHSAEDARSIVSDLIAAKRLDSPLRLSDSRVAGTIDVSDPVESSEAMCLHVAEDRLDANERQALGLSQTEGAKLSASLNPVEMASSARSILKRSGSGALQPSRRRRL